MTLANPTILEPIASSTDDHRDKLNAAFTKANSVKYEKGQAEHGGRLYEKDCSAFLLEEVFDFWNYAWTERQNKLKAIQLLEEFAYLTHLCYDHPVYQALLHLKGSKQNPR